MKYLISVLFCFVFTLSPCVASDPDDCGWISLFDGVSIEDWRASENQGTFKVVDGVLIVHGDRSHLFYEGPVEDHDFTDFELKLEILTKPGANSGVYFHTTYQEVGWPATGYEVQVNNTHSDKRKTGGLYAIDDNPDPFADNEWFTLTIRVEGKHIITKVNGKVISDYMEPKDPKREEGYRGRLLSSGTIAIQGHDPDSEVHYRNIKIRPLK
jgi:hypothetical protein